MQKTKISWCQYVWNPITGCTKVNSGCRNCYAEGIAKRFWGDRPFSDIRFHPERLLDKKLDSKKPLRIFVNSMSDLFHEKVANEHILGILAEISCHPQHTFLVLTKRAWRLKEFNAHYPPNLWLGCSASTQRDLVEVAKDLQDCDARIKWLSLEPLLGPLNILDVTRGDIVRQGNDEFLVPRINWIVVGCESGPKRRECRFDWVRDIAIDCSRVKIPLWIKQLQITTKNIVVDDVGEFPIELQIRQMPEVLDGK